MKSIQSLMDLTGRVALITGGAGFIGYAMCETLSELGASIVIVDNNEQKVAKAKKQLNQKYSNQITVIVDDLGSEKFIKSIPSQLKATIGRLDILINNAAFVGDSDLEGWVTDFENQSISTWNKALNINLTSAFTLTQACSDLLKDGGCGSVINIGSIYGVVGPDMSLYENTKMGNPAAYAASKGGLLQLTKWLSTIMAPDVRVNSLTPGGVFRGQPKSFIEKYIDRTPMKRMATEQDFKGSVAYLASDLSGYVTGQNLIVDGGWTVW